MLPSGASQFSIPGNYSALLWDVENKKRALAGRCLPSPGMVSIHLLTQVHSPGEDADRAPWGGSSIPMVLLIHPIPAEPWRGTCRRHRAPLFPLTKGRLWLVRCPSQAAPHGSQRGRALGCQAAPGSLTRSPACPQPHGSALTWAPRLSPPPRGSQAGRLQPAVYLMNYVCPGPVNEGSASAAGRGSLCHPCE